MGRDRFYGTLGLLCLSLAGAALGVPSVAEALQMKHEVHTTPLPPPGNGDAAPGELEAARRAGTIAAYDLFLARHPGHPLERAARRERRLIAERLRPPAKPQP
jgi:hypothetical protein